MIYSDNPVHYSIGLFDSGLGGLTILKAIRKALVHENILYFGDTARAPYGGRTPKTILRYCVQNTAFLLTKKIKLLLVACHTASAYSLGELQKRFSLPILGVVEAGIEAVVRSTKNCRIGVLATRATVASGVYQQGIKHRCLGAEVIPVACPLFVPLVEEGFTNHPAARLVVHEYVRGLRHSGIDTLLLGCTHYPLLKPFIQEALGDGVSVVDAGDVCAEMVSRLLIENNLQEICNENPQCRYYVSENPEKFGTLAGRVLGEKIQAVEYRKK